MSIDFQAYGFYIGVTGLLAAIVVPIAIYYLQNKKKKLLFEEIQNLSVIDVNTDFKDQIEIKYADKIVDSLYVSTARLKNTGHLPIKKEEFYSPIEIAFDVKIIKLDVIEVFPKGIEVEKDTVSEDKTVLCKFNLLNPGDYFTLQFVSLEKLYTPIITDRIEGLSKIDIGSYRDIHDDLDLLDKTATAIILVYFFYVILYKPSFQTVFVVLSLFVLYLAIFMFGMLRRRGYLRRRS